MVPGRGLEDMMCLTNCLAEASGDRLETDFQVVGSEDMVGHKNRVLAGIVKI